MLVLKSFLSENLVFDYFIGQIVGAFYLRKFDVVYPLELNEVSVRGVFDDIDISIFVDNVGDILGVESLSQFNKNDVFVIDNFFGLKTCLSKSECSLTFHRKHYVIFKFY